MSMRLRQTNPPTLFTMSTTEIPKTLIADSSVTSVSSQGQGSAWLLGHWWVAFAASSVAVVSGHLLIKAGLNALVPSPVGTSLLLRVLHEIVQPQVITGLLIYVLGTICWMKAVSQKEISFLYPLSSVNYVLVAAISVVIFHEVVSARRAAGVIVIVLGMILMTRERRKKSL